MISQSQHNTWKALAHGRKGAERVTSIGSRWPEELQAALRECDESLELEELYSRSHGRLVDGWSWCVSDGGGPGTFSVYYAAGDAGRAQGVEWLETDDPPTRYCEWTELPLQLRVAHDFIVEWLAAHRTIQQLSQAQS